MLDIPAFLDRRKFDTEGKLVYAPLADNWKMAEREWAPIKSASELRRKAAISEFYAEHPKLPVQVVTTEKKNLRMYENFEQFKSFHDFDDFPIKRVLSADGVTYVVVKMSNTAILADEIKDIPKVYHTVVKQNNVKRPKADSLCGRAWALYDQTLTGKTTITAAMELLKQGGMNPSTVRTQFAHWRTFNGIAK
jgi:hypothetical protein